ncbi:MAG: hypothetical protein JWQ15_648 [Marmoricola sp.]|nr:hypothetical protein [Marmoricola sp.]
MSHYLALQTEAPTSRSARGPKSSTAVVTAGWNTWFRVIAGHGVEKVNAGALFLMIGARPHTEWLPRPSSVIPMASS